MITRRALIEGAAAAGAIWLAPNGLGQSAATLPASTAGMQPWDVRRFGAKGDGQLGRRRWIHHPARPAGWRLRLSRSLS
jgi:hypothetical protein